MLYKKDKNYTDEKINIKACIEPGIPKEIIMDKFFIKLISIVVILISIIVGIYFVYENNSEMLWVIFSIFAGFAGAFIKQTINVTNLLAKLFSKISPSSVSVTEEITIRILENQKMIIEKIIIRHAIVKAIRKKILSMDNKKPIKKDARETITELFLAKSKVENLRAKFIAVIGLLALTIMSLFYSQSLLACIVPITFFIVLEVKIRVLEFRVTNGFFGTVRLEALQLLHFITDNKNKDDFDDKNGKRQIFVDLLKAEKNTVFNPENGVPL